MTWTVGEILGPTNLNAERPSWSTGWPVFDASQFSTIQAAVSAATSAGGGIVRLTASDYTQTSTITLAHNVILEGSGWSSRIRMNGPANFLAAITIPSGSSGWGVRNLTVDLSSMTTSNQNDCIKTSAGVQTGTIENCALLGSPRYGIIVQDGYNVHIRDNFVSGTSDTGILITVSAVPSGSSEILVMGNRVENGGATAQGIFVNQAGQYIRIIGNSVSSYNNGIRLARVSVTSMKNIVIADNQVSNNSGDGIRLMGHRIVCVGNSVYNNLNSGIKTGGQAGSDDAALQYSVIAQNSTSSNSNHGIQILERNCDYNVIANNSVCSNGGHGIFFGSFNTGAGTLKGNRVVSNVVVGNGFSGIDLDFSASSNTYLYFSLSENICANNGWSATGHNGISAGTAIWSTFVNNICYDDQTVKTQSCGIRTYGSSNSNTVGGNIAIATQHVDSGISLIGSNNTTYVNQT